MTDAERFFYSEFGMRVAVARQAKKMSQGLLAKRVKRARTSIVNLERGRQGNVSLFMVYEIGRVLEVPVTTLLPRRDK